MTWDRRDFFELNRLTGVQFSEDWHDDFDGIYEAAEAWVVDEPDSSLEGLVRDIDALFERVPDGHQRLRMFLTDYAWRRDDTEGFDAWLRAVRDRAAEAVAGIHHHPLVDPPS